MVLSSLTSIVSTFALLLSLASAYRPTQFCKHSGDNGHYDACFALTQSYNTTTDKSDLFIRWNAYRYDSNTRGWNALGLGRMMTGSLMFILYGDPTSTNGEMTITARTANGHHPPRPFDEMEESITGAVIPEIEILKSQFETYDGPFTHSKGVKPSHVGLAEIIVRGYTDWTGADVSNTSAAQGFIWSSNFKQDFQGDYSYGRAIDMHQFGLGFGFIWADLLNAETPTPMFGAIDATTGHRGLSEINSPNPPTEDELRAGEAYIKVNSFETAPTEALTDTIASTTSAAAIPAIPPPTQISTPSSSQLAAPIPPPPESTTTRSATLRNILWHLHGFFMLLSFLLLYPLGTYLLRSSSATAFNSHWTLQTLGSTSLLIGAGIGYLNSHSISITHQYVGLFLCASVIAQGILGWRHHVKYLETHNKTWMGDVHKYFGRFMLPLGAINIITGLMLREYGWFVIFLVGAVMVVEVVFLVLVIRFGYFKSVSLFSGRIRIGGGDGRVGGEQRPTDVEAEEYFQLAADDDDEFADEEDEVDRGKGRKTQEREKNERLRKLDRV